MKLGKQSVKFDYPPKIIAGSSVVGPREGEGTLGKYFDEVLTDDLYGEKSYELAECKMHKHAIDLALEKAKLTVADVDLILSGDLLNQNFASNFAARDFTCSFFGLYSACSTYGEGLILAATMMQTGNYKDVVVSTSSHFSTAERQYRFPLELGNQRTPLSQWTVTGAGATILDSEYPDEAPQITLATAGKIIDFGVSDANNMGAAMAPAAADTLITHFRETGRAPSYYDSIFTGDLGKFGLELTRYLCADAGYELPKSYVDCGAMIYAPEQQTFQGGSGAGCSNVVFNGFILRQMFDRKLNRILLVPTGALLSKNSTLQKQTIPAIAHAVSIEMPEREIKS